MLKGVGFATAGTHEALTYLGIVKKVIEKTERIVAKKNLFLPTGPTGFPELRETFNRKS